jgi:Phage head completion protein (GPL)
MGGLTANGTPIPNTGLPADGEPITNDGFWPNVDLGQMRAASRLTGNVTPERLRSAAIAAVIFVNGELAAYKAKQVADGWDSAADIGESIDGKSRIVQLYQRAVTSSVQADLADSYRDWDNTRAGDYRADVETVAADDFRRNASWAIADICGVRRNVTELI